MQAKFWTAALLGFVLIAASACGGSSGVTEEERLREQLEAEQEARAEAEEAASQAEEQLQAEEEARRKAEAEAEEERRKAAQAAEAEQEAEQAQQEAEQAQQEAEQARQEAQQQQEQLQRQLTEAEQAELRARASSFGAQLDLGATPASGSVTVQWPRGGSLTFRPAGTLTPGSAAPAVPGGWRSAGFTGQTGSATSLVDETVYLYTNIQAPGTRAFWKVHGLDEVMTAELALLAKASSASPTSGDTDTTTDGRQYEGLTISGSLNGAGGKFTCDCTGTIATGSTSGIDSHVTFTQGVPTFVTVGSWTFTPSNISNGYQVDEDDTHLHFGIWSSIPDSISATTLYDFEHIAGGGAESGGDLGNFALFEGSATFRGGAVGKYVTQGQVGQQNAKIGTFTATATLNADFGDGTAVGTLSGSITNFHEDGSPLVGWRVALGSSTDVGMASDIASGASSGSAVANIGGLPVGGSWAATFHGSDNEVLSPRTTYPTNLYPPVDIAGVTGWFDATGADASLAGAFAATPSN